MAGLAGAHRMLVLVERYVSRLQTDAVKSAVLDAAGPEASWTDAAGYFFLPRVKRVQVKLKSVQPLLQLVLLVNILPTPWLVYSDPAGPEWFDDSRHK